MGKSEVIWSMKELTGCVAERQKNKFDANVGVSGSRGNGKSTFLFHFFNSFKNYGFKQHKQQVYSREDVIKLLSTQQLAYCWDDEAINSGYKRDFSQTAQIDLIKIITNYRDNFNIYGSALPFFYNLDKALRELIFMHVHIIERGIGVILLPLEGQIHTQDPWDTQTNKKIEAKENIRLERNPHSKFGYHKLTTFAGYIYFGPMTKNQEAKYKAIKDKKRAREFQEKQEKDKPRPFLQKMYDFMLTGKLTQEGMMQACQLEGYKYSSLRQSLSKMLKDNGEEQNVSALLKASKQDLSKLNPQITNLVPDL